MQLKKGQSRVVLLLPYLGIAIKFPISRIFRFIPLILRELSAGGVRESWKFPVGVYGAPKTLLFKGLMDNRNEWKFWRKTRHPFLQPTLFSLFGLLNIQRLVQPCTLSERNHWTQLYQITGGMVFQDSHHFLNPANFCLHKGSLRMLDYSSPRTHAVIRKYGGRIIEEYDPDFIHNPQTAE